MPNFALICVLCVIAASSFPLEEIGRNAAALRRNVRQNNNAAAQPKQQRLKLSDLYTEGFINNVLKDETRGNGEKAAQDFKSDEDNASSVEDEDIDEIEEDVKSISHEDVDEAKDDKGNESVAKSESEKSDENVNNNESDEDSRSPENVGDNKDEKENDSEDESKYFVYSGRDHTNHNHLVNDFFNVDFDDDDDADDKDFDYAEYAEDFNDGYENYEDDDYIHNENDNGGQSDENRSNNNGLQNRNGNGIEFDNNLQENEIGNSIDSKHEASFVPEDYHRHHFSHQPSGGEFSLRTNRLNTGIQTETNFNAHRPTGNELGLGHKFPKDVVNW